MKIKTTSDLRNNLSTVLDEVIESQDPVTIPRGDSAVVIMAMADWESIQRHFRRQAEARTLVPPGYAVVILVDGVPTMHGPYKHMGSAVQMSNLLTNKAARETAQGSRVQWEILSPDGESVTGLCEVFQKWIPDLDGRERRVCRTCGESVVQLNSDWLSSGDSGTLPGVWQCRMDAKDPKQWSHTPKRKTRAKN